MSKFWKWLKGHFSFGVVQTSNPENDPMPKRAPDPSRDTAFRAERSRQDLNSHLRKKTHAKILRAVKSREGNRPSKEEIPWLIPYKGYDQYWRVLEDFKLIFDDGSWILIKAGFCTDFASTPQVIWSIMPPDDFGRKAPLSMISFTDSKAFFQKALSS
jgi:hypothetical protein